MIGVVRSDGWYPVVGVLDGMGTLRWYLWESTWGILVGLLRARIWLGKPPPSESNGQ